MTTSDDLARDLRDALRPLWRRLRAHKSLSAGKVGILAHLDREGPSSAADLAAVERISHQAAASAIVELASMGLVDRAPDPGDRRRVVVTLTTSGRAKLDDEREAGQDWLARAVADALSPSERETLAAAIPLLRQLDTATDGRVDA